MVGCSGNVYFYTFIMVRCRLNVPILWLYAFFFRKTAMVNTTNSNATLGTFKVEKAGFVLTKVFATSLSTARNATRSDPLNGQASLRRVGALQQPRKRPDYPSP